jgi:hypothetical protein
MSAVLPRPPTAAQQPDVRFMNEWGVKWHATQASPAVIRANQRSDWVNGPGASVPESRHRLILSGVGLGALLFLSV